MKKIIGFILGTALLLLVFSPTGCASKKKESLRLGLGLYTSAKATSATEDANGSGSASVTAAAILLDENNKITACVLDCAESRVSYSAGGKALAGEELLTKREQGDGYGMKAYGGASREWYEQADAFSALAIGKTLDSLKELVTEDGKGNDEVIRAGCTISVSDFVKAIEKAVQNAVPSEATPTDRLKLGASSTQTARDADGDIKGLNEIETTFFAATVDGNGKLTAAYTDCVQAEFTFDANGISQNDGDWILSSKRDAGDDYGMKAYGGAAKEWYEQAAAFDHACIGKTASEISGLVTENGKGSAELQSAGCTISVSGFVKAASKIG